MLKKELLIPPVQNLPLPWKKNSKKTTLQTNFKINFRKSHKIWGQNNNPFKIYFKKTDKGVVATPPVGIGLKGIW